MATEIKQKKTNIDKMDILTNSLTPYTSFHHFCLDALEKKTAPSISGSSADVKILADAFDARMKRRKSEIRAHRGNDKPNKKDKGLEL
jgi:hypothetical protein